MRSENGRPRVTRESGDERVDLVVLTRIESALRLSQEQLLIGWLDERAFVNRSGELDRLSGAEIGREDETEDSESEKPQPHMRIRPAVGPHTRV